MLPIPASITRPISLARATGRRRKAGLTCRKWGYGLVVRIGNVVIRPLGGVPGCLMMILVSVLLSAILTIALNLLFR